MSLFVDTAYSEALLLVAVGETRDETRRYLEQSFRSLTPDEVATVLAEALTGALASGVEREDIDPSLFDRKRR